MRSWREISRKLVFNSFLITVFRVGFRSEKSGKEGEFDILGLRDWMNVVPVTKNNEVILVKQFRYGIGADTLEFPAGTIETGQSPLETARRELLEETGGVPASIEELGFSHPNPALQGNRCFYFAAHGVSIEKPQSLDPFEEIELVTYPVDQVDELIASGKITHALSINAWHFFKNRKI